MTIDARIRAVLTHVAVGETVGVTATMTMLKCKRGVADETLLVMESRGLVEPDGRVYRRIK